MLGFMKISCFFVRIYIYIPNLPTYSPTVPFSKWRGTSVFSSCRKPLDGYMDLQLSIRIEEMVCELQLNTEKVVFLHHAIWIIACCLYE